MIAALVPFRAGNFARELMLRKLEAELLADRARVRHVLDVACEVFSAPAVLPPTLTLLNEVRRAF